MIKIIYIFTFLSGLFIANNAYAWNPLLFQDPSFLQFMLFEIPIYTSAAIAISGGLLTIKMVKDKISLFKYIHKLFMSNLKALALNLLVMALLVPLLFDSFYEPASEFIVWGGLIYFAAMFAYFAWSNQCKTVAKILDQKKSPRKVSAILFIVNAISYTILYTIVYNSLF